MDVCVFEFFFTNNCKMMIHRLSKHWKLAMTIATEREYGEQQGHYIYCSNCLLAWCIIKFTRFTVFAAWDKHDKNPAFLCSHVCMHKVLPFLSNRYKLCPTFVSRFKDFICISSISMRRITYYDKWQQKSLYKWNSIKKWNDCQGVSYP